jgi:hypothetical protein
VAAILASQMNPEISEPLRYASLYGQKATMLAKLHNVYTFAWNMTPYIETTRLQLPVNDTAAFLFGKDPIRHLVYNRVAPGTASQPVFYNYQAVFSEDNVGRGNLSQYQYDDYDSKTPLAPCYWQSVASLPTVTNPPSGAVQATAPAGAVSWAPHGPFAYSGHNPSRTKFGFWLDTSPVASAQGGGISAGIVVTYSPETMAFLAQAGNDGRIQIDIDRWDGRDLTYYASLNVGAGATPATTTGTVIRINDNGYYCVSVHWESGVANVFNPVSAGIGFGLNVFSCMSASMSHNAVQDFNPSWAVGAGLSYMRVNGASMWAMNRCSDLNKQGSLVAVQSSPGQDWQFTYFNAGQQLNGSPAGNCYNFIQAQAGERDFEAATGYYGYFKSANEDGFKFRQPVMQGRGAVAFNPGQPQMITFPLLDDQGFIALAINTQQATGGDFQLKTHEHIEYVSSYSWLTGGIPTTEVADWDEAKKVILPSPSHFENPEHNRSIGARILSAVGRYAPTVAKYFSYIPGPVGTVGSIVSSGVGSLARWVTGEPDPDVVEADVDMAEARDSVKQAIMKRRAVGGIPVKKRRAF